MRGRMGGMDRRIRDQMALIKDLDQQIAEAVIAGAADVHRRAGIERHEIEHQRIARRGVDGRIAAHVR